MKTGHSYHKDSFGQLQTVLTGVTTWTLRALRNTKVAVAHIAKNDVFSYKAQLNHEKKHPTGCNAHWRDSSAAEPFGNGSKNDETGYHGNGHPHQGSGHRCPIHSGHIP